MRDSEAKAGAALRPKKARRPPKPAGLAEPLPVSKPKNARRALSHVGGMVELHGDPGLGEVLKRSLMVDPGESSTLHVHGFHTYTARMHPETAARLIRGLTTRSGAHLLDPFCGSGTVLAEGRLEGHHVFGLDANPLAIELSWLKTLGPSDAWIADLLQKGREAAAYSDARRKSRSGPSRKYDQVDLKSFDIHVLLELDGLRLGLLEGEMTPDQRRALFLVLSAVLGKVSRSPEDSTTRTAASRRLAPGFSTRFFVQKLEELGRRLHQYSALLPKGAPAPRGAVGDARDLRAVKDRSMNLVLTSPPYPGVYDYHTHHAVRLRWLDLKSPFEKIEIGSRRKLGKMSPESALRTWQTDFLATLRQMRRVLKKDGLLALLIADTALGDRPVFADELVTLVAREVRLEVLAHAAQRRPHFHSLSARAFGNRPRREHLLVLSG